MKHTHIIILIIFFIICILYYQYTKNIYEIKTIDELNKLSEIEIKFKKIYPIGNDFFKIVHYPTYSDFFIQFKKYRYAIYKINNEIVGTVGYCELNNENYLCDFKTFKKGLNFSKKLFVKYFFEKSSYFGIVMHPNKIIENLSKKYNVNIYEKLFLYNISYNVYIKNIELINKIFPNHFMIHGFKKLILDSNNQEIKISHIATIDDKKYINYDHIYKSKIQTNKDYNIMFQIPKSNKYVEILKKNNIDYESIMMVYGYNSKITDWNFIRTYMI
jgi:hypothetical protein